MSHDGGITLLSVDRILVGCATVLLGTQVFLYRSQTVYGGYSSYGESGRYWEEVEYLRVESTPKTRDASKRIQARPIFSRRTQRTQCCLDQNSCFNCSYHEWRDTGDDFGVLETQERNGLGSRRNLGLLEEEEELVNKTKILWCKSTQRRGKAR